MMAAVPARPVRAPRERRNVVSLSGLRPAPGPADARGSGDHEGRGGGLENAVSLSMKVSPAAS